MLKCSPQHTVLRQLHHHPLICITLLTGGPRASQDRQTTCSKTPPTPQSTSSAHGQRSRLWKRGSKCAHQSCCSRAGPPARAVQLPKVDHSTSHVGRPTAQVDDCSTSQVDRSIRPLQLLLAAAQPRGRVPPPESSEQTWLACAKQLLLKRSFNANGYRGLVAAGNAVISETIRIHPMVKHGTWIAV